MINQTEALVAIDVNTGKLSARPIASRTPLPRRIPRRLKKSSADSLRDLGGIIVTDFIDMDERKTPEGNADA